MTISIPAYRFASLVIVVIAVVITFLISLHIIITPITSSACRFVLPLGGIQSFEDCTNIQNTNVEPYFTSSKSVLSKVNQISNSSHSNPENSSEKSHNIISNVTIPDSTKYLVGTWAISGYLGTNIVSSKATIDTNGSYHSTGRLWNDNFEIQYKNGGNYIIDSNKTAINYVENDGSNSIYILDVLTSKSFIMYNPNSLEYYRCVRLSV